MSHDFAVVPKTVSEGLGPVTSYSGAEFLISNINITTPTKATAE